MCKDCDTSDCMVGAANASSTAGLGGSLGRISSICWAKNPVRAGGAQWGLANRACLLPEPIFKLRQ
jgi:hypothetical protein